MVALFVYSSHKKNKIIYIILGLFIIIFPYIKITLYQLFYGQPINYEISTPLNAEITMLPEAEKQTFKRGKYTIEISPKAQIDLSARVVYMQYNDSLLSSFDYYANPLYDTISPLDVSVFIKSMADNWKEYEVRHEKRLLLIKGQKTIAHEWQNIHIVPANNVIYKGFATVKQGDIIKLKGFLIDWTGYYNQSQIYAETALSFDSASKERAAGRFTFLCMQFFVTELYANNYLFK